MSYARVDYQVLRASSTPGIFGSPVFSSPKERVVSIALFSLTSVSVIRDLARVEALLDPYADAFGSRWPVQYFAYLDLQPSPLLLQLAVCICVLVLSVVIIKLLQPNRQKDDPRQRPRIDELVFGVTFVSVFVAGMSFDYRLILASLLFLGVKRQDLDKDVAFRLTRLFGLIALLFSVEVGMAIAVAQESYLLRYVAAGGQLLGDLSSTLLAALALATILRGLLFTKENRQART